MKILYFDNGLCNTYIVKDKKILQIDAGSKTNIKPDILILTHSHFDHTSFIPKNCEIWCSKECKEHVESNDIVTLIPFFDFKKRRIKVSKILKDGDIISLGNIKLKKSLKYVSVVEEYAKTIFPKSSTPMEGMVEIPS